MVNCSSYVLLKYLGKDCNTSFIVLVIVAYITSLNALKISKMGFLPFLIDEIEFNLTSVSSVQLLRSTICDPMECSTPGFPVHHQLPEFAQTHVHWLGDAIQHLILCHTLHLPSIFPSIRVFSNESVPHIRWPKYWSFSISLSNGYSGLISFRMNWLDLLAVQGTLKSLLQHDSSKASILLCSTFFIVQLSYPYMTTGKTIALTRWTFVGKVMSLFFNMLCRLVAFLPRRKRLLISWLQSPSAVILEPRKKVSHCFHYFPIYLPWSDGTRWRDLSFLNVEF